MVGHVGDRLVMLLTCNYCRKEGEADVHFRKRPRNPTGYTKICLECIERCSLKQPSVDPNADGRNCTICGDYKPWEEFPPGEEFGVNGRKGYCYKCNNQQNRARHTAKRKRINEGKKR